LAICGEEEKKSYGLQTVTSEGEGSASFISLTHRGRRKKNLSTFLTGRKGRAPNYRGLGGEAGSDATLNAGAQKKINYPGYEELDLFEAL